MSTGASRKAATHRKGCSQYVNDQSPVDFGDLYLACHEPVTLAIYMASAHFRHIRAIQSRDTTFPERNLEPQSRACLSCLETGFPQEKPGLSAFDGLFGLQHSRWRPTLCVAPSLLRHQRPLSTTWLESSLLTTLSLSCERHCCTHYIALLALIARSSDISW